VRRRIGDKRVLSLINLALSRGKDFGVF